MKHAQSLLAPVLLCVAALSLTACDRDGPAERVGERVDEGVDDADRALDRAGDEIEEAGEEAGERLDDGADRVRPGNP